MQPKNLNTGSAQRAEEPDTNLSGSENEDPLAHCVAGSA
jgi:hypothetical protein